MRAREAGEQRRQDARADRLERADANRAGGARAKGFEIGVGRAQRGDDAIGVAQQERPGVGRAERAATAAALEQAHPDDPLERADLLAQRGLGVAEPGGGARERALLDDRVERGEVAQLGAQQPISTIHRSRNEL